MKIILTLASLLALSVPSDAAQGISSLPYYRLAGVIDEDTAKESIEFLAAAAKSHARAAIIEINSPGGRVDEGFEIARAIETAPMAVVCVADGEAASMAFYILQSCDVRIMTRRSRLMTHEPVAVLAGSYTSNELKGMAEEMEAAAKAFAEHCRRRLTTSEGEYHKRTMGGSAWHMAWEEALRIHAVDQVVPSVGVFLKSLARMAES